MKPKDWPIGETRVIPSHRPDVSDNHLTRTGENTYIGFNTYQPSETVRELEAIRSELETETVVLGMPL